MSKAFTREDSESEVEEDFAGDEDSGVAEIPKGQKNYITNLGLERLKEELHQIGAVERPKVVETVAWAASNGDRSENADYQYGKKRLREIDRRIRFLHKRIDAAEVVIPEKQSGDKVLFGATVVVQDDSDNERTYRIVGIDETDVSKGKISWISPIGQALLQGKKGDVVTVKMPRGDEDFEILNIQYVAVPK
jgi:transcription elongation factor GreB